jgi:hypothetical protein
VVWLVEQFTQGEVQSTQFPETLTFPAGHADTQVPFESVSGEVHNVQVVTVPEHSVQGEVQGWQTLLMFTFPAGQAATQEFTFKIGVPPAKQEVQVV